MAENIARDTQYQYRATASLVLQQDRSGHQEREKEPTGEPVSIWGVYDPRQMGDRAQRSRPQSDGDRVLAKETDAQSAPFGKTANRVGAMTAKERITTGFGANSVLDAVDDFEGLSYRPRTRETKDAYTMILHFCSTELGDHSQETLRSATDEILAICKDLDLKDFDKKRQVDDILGYVKGEAGLSAEAFNQLLNLTKRITDYGAEQETEQQNGALNDGTLDEEVGVAVVFDEEEEEDVLEVQDRDDDEDKDEADEEDASEMDKQPVDSAAMDEVEVQVHDRQAYSKEASDTLSPLEIDAYWLQRIVSSYFPDPLTSQTISNQIMDILGNTKSARECENALVQLLNYGNFELVKLVTKNRLIIYWCTLLARTHVDEQDSVISRIEDAGLGWIVQTLKNDIATAEEPKRRPRPLEDLEMGTEPEHPRKRQMTLVDKISALAPKNLLDLDMLSFKQGSHLMTNKKCELPKGSFKTSHKGFEEITVPAPKPALMTEKEQLKPIEDLVDWVKPAFKSAKTLNRLQSRVYPVAFESDENMLVCAPTGAGKTNVAMLTILRAMSQFRDPESTLIDVDKFKIIYIAPMKALVQEVVGNFTNRLTDAFGIKVAELTGDRQLTKQQIAETQIIVTTPEKWDIITRKAHDRSYTQLVRLIIIDEIHLLHDDRGPVLESVVSRTIRNIIASRQFVRLVGLSATLPNYMDVATFLHVDRDIGLFHFDNSYRPCPLMQKYIGITEKKVIKRLQMMNEICYEKCLAEAGKNQTMVFVHSRKETAKTCRAIRDLAIDRETIGLFLRQDSASREILASEAESVKSKDLQELLPFGFAIHHAGMTRADRTLVEELFADGHIQVLVTTATLAWGVNLPAHTVIIKGTQVYSPEKGRWMELSPQDVLQMLGRAGRPQYDTFGEGIIITSHQELQFYLSLLNTQLPIESQLMSRLPDMLNAEIVLGTVRNRDDAIQWLTYTYLYIRMLREPYVYGVHPDEKEEDAELEQKRIDLIHAAAVLLDKAQLIKYDRKTGSFQGTDLGRIASHYYITHRSMATYNQHLKPSTGMIDLFRIFALSEEFRFIPVREEEKMEVQKFIERVPVPVKDGVDEPVAKINVLLQAYISQLKLDGFALMADMVYITQSAGRILRAIFEIALRREWAQLVRKAMDLCKMVDKRMWLSMTPLRQFKGVNMELLRRLEKKEFQWDRMFDLNPQELGELVRNPKAGKLLHRLVHQFPRIELQTRVQPITRSILRMDLTLTPDFTYDTGSSEESRTPVHNLAGEMFWVFVEDCDQERILFQEQFILKPRYAEDDHHLSFTVPLHEPLPPNYFVSVISDRWLHSETKLPVSFKHLLLPAKFPPHTELLDLQPLPISTVRIPEFIKIFAERGWKYFNPVQTQVFNSLFNGNDNILVGAPAGSGKTVCAELAIMRHIILSEKCEEDPGKIVYVAPHPDICHERFLSWRKRFESIGKSVGKLAGESSADLKTLELSDIIIATPEQWDMLSRRWKQRKNVRAVDLFIVDELHLVGGHSGAVMEVIVSRTRFMASQLEKNIRIVALSASVGNSRDLGEWLGCKSGSESTIFNFHPNVRPVPLEIHIQSFSIPHFSSLMLAMIKPCFLGISQFCCNGENSGVKQAIVFVPSRAQSRLTALELVTLASNEGSARKFLHLPDIAFDQQDDETYVEGRAREILGPYLEKLSDQGLQECLTHGVGYVNEGLADRDRRIVLRLYQRGVLQVLCVSRELLFALTDLDTGDPIDAHMCVIYGTQYFDGQQHRYVDYSLSDVFQMCGKSCRGEFSGTGQTTEGTGLTDEGMARVLLLCPAQRKEFYKKFLNEGLPVESHLDHSLHDHFNAEIVTKTIETKQDAVDYLTWTFLYRRMAQNPNYYNLIGVTHQHLSDHLSELVETTLSDLTTSRCISIDEDEMSISALNLGMIAAYRYVHFITIEVFSMSLTAGTKLRGLLEIICSAAEFDVVPIRHHEDMVLQKLYERCPVRLAPTSGRIKFTDPHVKANILLQAHFSRLQLPSDLQTDLNKHILPCIVPLVGAAVNVLSTNGWLSPAMAALELCQMVVQALWGDRESPLRQLPYFDQSRIELAERHGIVNMFDFLEIEDESVRSEILTGLKHAQIAEVARVVNQYPNDGALEESTEANGLKESMKVIVVSSTSNIQIQVRVARDLDEEEDANIGPVYAPFFPNRKDEGWWLVVGEPETKQLVGIKEFTLQRQFKCRLDFEAPQNPGQYRYKLYLMSDSWLGCDQEYEFSVRVEEGMDEDAKEDENM